MYLGSSTKIGVLDKGGVFRKGDWYAKVPEKVDCREAFVRAKEEERKRFERAFKGGSQPVASKRTLSYQELTQLMAQTKQSQ